MPIRLLTDEVASQIAAGEVVERPASVVKELVENALDAGATQIQIEIEGAGRNLIRVSDNGLGIPQAEVELAFRRHATSKITSANDLVQVQTLGFRGEALASIASVSRVEMLTRAAAEKLGSQVQLAGGQVQQIQPIGAPQGTVVQVEALFYNVPARLKFLKTDSSERNQILRLVTRLAMAAPQVRFRLLFDNRLAFATTGSGSLVDVLLEVFGIEIARQLLPVPPLSGSGGVTVSGYISPPDVNRANRADITLFINGRWVQSTRLNAAVTQAYHTLLPPSRYPIVVLKIDLPPEEVDVNVHPAKAEVRFRNDNLMFGAVERTVRQTLLNEHSPANYQPREWHSGWQSGFDLRTPNPSHAQHTAPSYTGTSDSDSPVPLPDSSAATQTEIPTPNLPLLRVVGQIGAAYVVAEGPDGLYLIDQYAAHSRVLYEAYLAQSAAENVPGQSLLQPAAVSLSSEAVTQLLTHQTELAQLGFELEAFGPNTVLVRGVPTVLGALNPNQALSAIIDDFEEDESLVGEGFRARAMARLSKRAAVRAGQVLTQQEQVALVQRLEQCENPRSCPHGRPTMIHISVDVLARQFGRR